MKNFLSYLNPVLWMRNEGTDLVWDKALNKLLDEFHLVPSSLHRDFVHLLGDNLIWTGNYPYAYGSFYGLAPFNFIVGSEMLPKRSTVLRLKRAVDKLEKYNVLDHVKFKETK